MCRSLRSSNIFRSNVATNIPLRTELPAVASTHRTGYHFQRQPFLNTITRPEFEKGNPK